ncbi:protein S40-7-like [Cornus florida]|uniref:protein S40-7-like n=1 Tax=Cornus florida TaxID=4283 RepID=UPI0028A185CF|nr:protein S40-7-like [Cornus florida]
MEPKGVVSFRHRRSPSSDRFLDVFSPPKSSAGATAVNIADDEISEDEVFWTGDFSEPNRPASSLSATAIPNHHRQILGHPEKFGILAALPEDNRKYNRPVLCRKPSISSSSTTTSSSRAIPAIPKPPQQNLQEREYSQSMPTRKLQQSAPMNVPVMLRKVRNGELAEVDVDDGEDEEMLPPHEIVARGSAMSQMTTFSVLEGVGRTLKGRDLRQVRNAVWRKTGFLD